VVLLLGSAIFHFEINKLYRRKGFGTILLNNMLKMIKENIIRIIIGKSCEDENIKKFLIKNKFTAVKSSELYFAMEGIRKLKQ